MRRTSTTFRDRVAPAGFATTLVVVLLVLMVVLGTAIVTLTTTQSASLVTDVQGVKAYQAARAGLEWGAHHVLRTPTVLSCAAIDSGGIGTTFALTGNLLDFRVTVRCASTDHTDPAPVTTYEVSAVGCNLPAGSCLGASPSGPFYVERSLRITLSST